MNRPLVWILALTLWAMPSVGAAGDDVLIPVATGLPEGVAAEVRWTPTAGGEERTCAATACSLPEGSVWTACLEAPGFWAPCEVVEARREQGLRFSPLPTVIVHGRFAEGEWPDRLRMAFSLLPKAGAPSAAGGLTRHSVHCHLAEKAWRCEVPAARLDLEIRPAGFAPVYRFGIDLGGIDLGSGDLGGVDSGGGEAFDLGTMALRRGASLVGWVETASGKSFDAGARARLSPLAPRTALRERLTSKTDEVAVSATGFFQLSGLAAGTYLLEIEHPAYAISRQFPLELWDGRETRLAAPLILQPPMDLRATIDPPLDPSGRPWIVELLRRSPLSGAAGSEFAFQGPASRAGEVVVRGEAPGTFSLQVKDRWDNSFFIEPWLTVEPGEGDIEVRLDLIEVVGRLTHRDEGIAGTISFGGRHVAPRVAMEADREGAFHGVVAEDGWWRVEIEAEGLERVARVEVVPDGAGVAKVEIELPASELSVSAVDQDGAAVEGAWVTLVTVDGALSDTTDEGGEATFRAFTEGVVWVSAEGRRRGESLVSDHRTVEVREDAAPAPVELILRPKVAVSGAVTSERGPVPGAIVDLWVAEPVVASGFDRRSSDGGGRFEARLPAAARQLTAIVSPPGHALKAFSLPMAERVSLEVPAAGGSLRVATGIDRDYRRHENPEVLAVMQDGIPLSAQVLSQWRAGHGVTDAPGATITYPKLAPGHYRACARRAAPTLPRHPGVPSAGERCAEGYLAAGGLLELELPRD
ncbi:MAG: hypothetical protein AAF604_01010 [Acidobacteriota bacterium]